MHVRGRSRLLTMMMGSLCLLTACGDGAPGRVAPAEAPTVARPAPELAAPPATLVEPAQSRPVEAVVAVAAVDPRRLELGERMYREGVLPSGGLLEGATRDGAAARGTTFACVACHLRSGLGAREEGLVTPPINGVALGQPRYSSFVVLTPAERAALLPPRYQSSPVRPAYTDGTLVEAITGGRDPAGRELNPVMPRYRLSADDAAILVDYLGRLSVEPSPGVTDTTLALATVITDDVPQADRDAMMRALTGSIQRHNVLRNSAFQSLNRIPAYREQALCYRDRTLAQWILEGPPASWPEQLEAYYRRAPVFALVGGLSTRSWEPIHRFCEQNRIPCILPLTDLPVISTSDVYTLYFSKGYYQEGETAARYLSNALTARQRARVLQVVAPGPEARALSEGFLAAWSELGNEPPETVVVAAGAVPDVRALQGASDSALLLWTGAEAHRALASLAAVDDRPAAVILSSTRLGGRLWELPEEARPFTYVTWPFRTPGRNLVTPKMGGPALVVNKEYRNNDGRIASRAATLVEVLEGRLTELRRSFYRDRLLDLFGTMPEQLLTDYEDFSFDPARRYGASGCYVMQLSDGPEPTLVRKSDWAL